MCVKLRGVIKKQGQNRSHGFFVHIVIAANALFLYATARYAWERQLLSWHVLKIRRGSHGGHGGHKEEVCFRESTLGLCFHCVLCVLCAKPSFTFLKICRTKVRRSQAFPSAPRAFLCAFCVLCAQLLLFFPFERKGKTCRTKVRRSQKTYRTEVRRSQAFPSAPRGARAFDNPLFRSFFPLISGSVML